jgi:hypothetical protein
VRSWPCGIAKEEPPGLSLLVGDGVDEMPVVGLHTHQLLHGPLVGLQGVVRVVHHSILNFLLKHCFPICDEFLIVTLLYKTGVIKMKLRKNDTYKKHRFKNGTYKKLHV